MENKKVLEERLREAACLGDKDTVQQFINLGVDVNARHSVNGWTPLHWACKQGNVEVATLLLKNGADRSIVSLTGETPASLCTNQLLLRILNTANDQILSETTSASTLHNFVPSYAYKNDSLNASMDTVHIGARGNISEESKNANRPFEDELVLKIRIANTPDPDFIEVELSRNELTYQNLVRICCEELDVCSIQIMKLRKLPNTRLRKDKDVQRLRNFEEIEVVTDAVPMYKFTPNSNGVPNVPTVPANGYQSMSKKDQVILY